ncbi:MAG: tetratricopeptide repeat protein [Firmicutes bacterium]|nr:tetratricopeptide repeat protein [Bacillota bacterium]
MWRKIIVFVLFVLPLTIAPALADRAAAEKHYRAALELSKTDIGKAEAEFRAAIAEDGKYVPALLGLARLLLEAKGEPAEAVVYLDRALAQDAENFEAHLMKGVCLLRIGGKDPLAEALESFKEAVRIQPDSPAAHRLLALTHAALGEAEEARKEYETAVRLAPDDAQVRFELGMLLVNMGRPAEAVPYLEKAAALGPKAPEYPWALGMTYKKMKKYAEAIATLEKAATLATGRMKAGILSDLGTVHAEKKDYKSAIACYERALKESPEFAPAHYNLACAYARQGKVAEAIKALAKAIELDPGFRELAKKDPDFDPIGDDKKFKELLEEK